MGDEFARQYWQEMETGVWDDPGEECDRAHVDLDGYTEEDAAAERWEDETNHD